MISGQHIELLGASAMSGFADERLRDRLKGLGAMEGS